MDTVGGLRKAMEGGEVSNTGRGGGKGREGEGRQDLRMVTFRPLQILDAEDTHTHLAKSEVGDSFRQISVSCCLSPETSKKKQSEKQKEKEREDEFFRSCR